MLCNKSLVAIGERREYVRECIVNKHGNDIVIPTDSADVPLKEFEVVDVREKRI